MMARSLLLRFSLICIFCIFCIICIFCIQLVTANLLQCENPTLLIHTSLDGDGSQRCSTNEAECSKDGDYSYASNVANLCDSSFAAFNGWDLSFQEDSYSSTTVENNIGEALVNFTNIGTNNGTFRIWANQSQAPTSVDEFLDYLYLYNFDSSTWIQVDSNIGDSGDLDSGTISIPSNYISSGGTVSAKLRTQLTNLLEYEDGTIWYEIQMDNQSNYTLDSCTPPASGDWTISDGDNCVCSTPITITGDLILNTGNLNISNGCTLTIQGGEIYMYNPSQLNIFSGGQING